ncbi:hypothetical protein MOMA_00580 [Moraxella macacae 0408225]|uniref:Lipopolysaccharide export system protein LptC n=1 Tax=Moraxella macacae 0408225 TaxID=1230338 RepID=L2F745_9GAMM|nr:LPS export ABC transporter periplasmic protein LptC [Moraxella macacae]ELA08862.1 hypothetical protein MOMA_00580 [Moraxella macacae 0408225]
MSTKTLLILGLMCIAIAGYFYQSSDSSLATLELKASDIDYEAGKIEAVQTDATGAVSYRMTADGVTHYQNTRFAVLDKPTITLYNQANKTAKITAGQATLDEVQQIVRLTNRVMVVNWQNPSNSSNPSSQPIWFTTEQMLGNLKTKQVMSDHKVQVNQAGNVFNAQKMFGNIATGEYQFDKVEMTFLPNQNN